MLNLQNFLNRAINGEPSLKVLEAGCGSASYLTFGKNPYITGIDISEQQLSRNACLNEAILGDVQYYDFKEASYDIIVCWDVLEHLQRPDLALKNFSQAINKGGFIILGLPNVLSLKGLLTKYLPYKAHVWVYKYLYGIKDAGKNDTTPFRTVMKYDISGRRIRRYADSRGLSVAYSDTRDGVYVKNKTMAPIIQSIYKIARITSTFMSFGILGKSELIIVLRKE